LATERVERRLAAILAADVAGYSRLVGADEEGTPAPPEGAAAWASRSEDRRPPRPMFGIAAACEELENWLDISTSL
jgi:hypothetical protein